MNFMAKAGLAALVAVSPFIASLTADDDKVQKIAFIADDGQSYIYTKIYELKHTRAVDLRPFVKTAIMRCNGNSTISAVSDSANKRQLLIVSTKHAMIPYVDEMIKALDRPGKVNADGSIIEGTGAVYGTYAAKFRSNDYMTEIMKNAGVTNGDVNGVFKRDPITGLFYFKDTPSGVPDIKAKLAWLDKPVPQVSIELKIYEVRDSDMRDIGLDYLAWKNGPGMNLFEVGYNALSTKVAETIVEGASNGIDLLGNFSYGFGGVYTAPAFDLSFVRILQQNGKASINSTASVAVQNEADRVFSVSFAPEYQNITKDEDHRSDVTVGGDSTLTATISAVTVTNPVSGVVNFNYSLNGYNVVERNNLGEEITEGTSISSSVTLDFKNEKVLASWERTSRVDQTIGIPFLCELPILRYIFGTTTTNIEKTRYIVTARAVLLKYDKNVVSGVVKDFDELVKK